MIFSVRCLTLLFIILFWVTGSLSGEDMLSFEVWCELDPIDFEHPDSDPTLSQQEAFQRLFEEARQVVSGMVYGYRFVYIPLDKKRGAREFFEVTPLAEIRHGDANLRLVSRDIEDNRLYGRFTYTLLDFQRLRRESWNSITLPAESGRGQGKLPAGIAGKKTARETAIKEAVRNHLRPIIFNKPREIRGEAAILDAPRTIISAGIYVTTVKIKINIRKIVPYTVF